MKLTLMAALMLALVGCGTGAVDEEFAGTWQGPVVVTFANGNTHAYTGTVRASVHDDVLEMWQLCYDGGGRMQAEGSGREVSWAGVLVCPVPSASCPSAQLTYERATAWLGDSGGLEMVARGEFVGCGIISAITTTFQGAKR